MNNTNIKIMSDEDYDRIIERIDRVSKEFQEYVRQSSNPMKEKWVDNADACRILNVSTRSLQNYRDKRILPYSALSGKIYYKASDIEAVLNQNYSKSA